MVAMKYFCSMLSHVFLLKDEIATGNWIAGSQKFLPSLSSILLELGNRFVFLWNITSSLPHTCIYQSDELWGRNALRCFSTNESWIKGYR